MSWRSEQQRADRDSQCPPSDLSDAGWILATPLTRLAQHGAIRAGQIRTTPATIRSSAGYRPCGLCCREPGDKGHGP